MTGPVVLVPGLTFNASVWGEVQAALLAVTPTPSVVAVQLPGHGDAPAQHVVSPRHVADDVERLLSGTRPSVVVGHSWGVMAAIEIAHLTGASALLTLDQRLDPAGLPLPATGIPDADVSTVAGRLCSVIDDAVAEVPAPMRSTPVDLAPFVRALRDGPGALLTPVHRAAAALRIRWRDVHRHEPGPAHRSLLPPTALVERWPGRGHAIPWEQPDLVARAIIELGQS